MSKFDDEEPKPEISEGGVLGFLKSLLMSILRDLVKLVLSFIVGTGAGAIVCWYYGIPLGFSILGGILVLALALAISTDSLFS